MNAEVIQPGVIQGGPGKIFMGENNGDMSTGLRWLQSLFETSNIRCIVCEDIHHDVWRKFAWNCIFNIVSAITQLTVGKIFDDPGKIQLCKHLFKEISQVANPKISCLELIKKNLFSILPGILVVLNLPLYRTD